MQLSSLLGTPASRDLYKRTLRACGLIDRPTIIAGEDFFRMMISGTRNHRLRMNRRKRRDSRRAYIFSCHSAAYEPGKTPRTA